MWFISLSIFYEPMVLTLNQPQIACKREKSKNSYFHKPGPDRAFNVHPLFFCVCVRVRKCVRAHVFACVCVLCREIIY